MPSDYAGVEEINVATMYTMMFPIFFPIPLFPGMVVQRGCTAELVEDLHGHCQISWVLHFFLGTVFFLGVAFSPGHYKFLVRYLLPWTLCISQCTTEFLAGAT